MIDPLLKTSPRWRSVGCYPSENFPDTSAKFPSLRNLILRGETVFQVNALPFLDAPNLRDITIISGPFPPFLPSSQITTFRSYSPWNQSLRISLSQMHNLEEFYRHMRVDRDILESVDSVVRLPSLRKLTIIWSSVETLQLLDWLVLPALREIHIIGWHVPKLLSHLISLTCRSQCSLENFISAGYIHDLPSIANLLREYPSLLRVELENNFYESKASEWIEVVLHKIGHQLGSLHRLSAAQPATNLHRHVEFRGKPAPQPP
ncbi:hypothetical protein B0H19DRAFT_321754 [Mycena capillaripes]|nr:hypothetical protein B0H19DRAFT_321754 [Mycena capillaripes]